MALYDVSLLDTTGRPALHFAQVSATVTPRSIWRLGVEQLRVDQPILEARRKADGQIEVAGLAVSGSDNQDNRFTDWLFSVPELQVRGGTVRWTDEAAAPPGPTPPLAALVPNSLELSQVDAVLRNGHRSHQIRIDASPPVAWGARFNISAIFQQPLFSRHAGAWQRWSGTIFSNFASVDLAQLGHYTKLASYLRQGRGALRSWVDVAQGRIVGVTTDLSLADVSAQLGTRLDPLGLQSLEGRISAKRSGAGVALGIDNLHVHTRDGRSLSSGTLTFVQTPAQARQAATGKLQASGLDLAALTAIARSLPLPDKLRENIASYALAGTVNRVAAQWTGPMDAPLHYQATGQISDLHIAAHASESVGNTSIPTRFNPGRPGVTGASVDFGLSESGGSARLRVHNGVVELPGVLEDPKVPVADLATDLQWSIKGTDWQVQAKSLQVANDDAQGSLSVDWRTDKLPPGTPLTARFPGILDLQGTLTRANVAKVYRYLPLGVPNEVRNYLRAAVIAGQASNVQMRIHGNLRDFPFVQPSDTNQFHIEVPISDGTYAYIPPSEHGPSGWPALQQLSASLVIDNGNLSLQNASARIAGATSLRVDQTQALISNITTMPVVSVTGRITGPAHDMLEATNHSELADITSHALGHTSASGQANLQLAMSIPLSKLDQTRVNGSVTVDGAELRDPVFPLPLSQAHGIASFDEKGLRTISAQGTMLGGTVRIEGNAMPSAGADEHVFAIHANGTATVSALHNASGLEGLDFLTRIASGATSYTASVALRRSGPPAVEVSSNLQGLALALPQPVGKTADATVPLRLTLVPQGLAVTANHPQEQELMLEMGGIGSAQYVVTHEPSGWRVLRGSLALGLSEGEAAPVPESGVAANLRFSHLDIDAWDKALTSLESASKTGAASGIDVQSLLPTSLALRAQELTVDGRTLHNMVVGGSRAGLVWRANVDAQELNGYVEYRQPNAGSAGQVYARLAHLDLGQSATSALENTLDQQPSSVPALDIVVDNMVLQGKHFGHVEVQAVNQQGGASTPKEWLLTKLSITNPDGTLSASGNWAAQAAVAAPQSQFTTAPASPDKQPIAPGTAPDADAPGKRRRTSLNFKLAVADSGAMLSRFGQSGLLRNGRGAVEGTIGWNGSPFSIDYPSLSGQLALNVGAGQFLKTDPGGAARLLSVLSLQSLPRILTLDFRGAFAEGFAFDFLRGDVKVHNGVASTNNLQMKGVSATVLMDGKADIAHETQDVQVLIVPQVNAGTASLLAGLLNPAVGLGTFILQLFASNPLSRANTQELHIDGSWSNPRVTKIDHKPSTNPEATKH